MQLYDSILTYERRMVEATSRELYRLTGSRLPLEEQTIEVLVAQSKVLLDEATTRYRSRTSQEIGDERLDELMVALKEIATSVYGQALDDEKEVIGAKKRLMAARIQFYQELFHRYGERGEFADAVRNLYKTLGEYHQRLEHIRDAEAGVVAALIDTDRAHEQYHRNNYQAETLQEISGLRAYLKVKTT